MMVEKIRALLAAPTFPDDNEKTRQSAVLNTILWASLLCIVLFGLMAPFAYEAVVQTLVITAVLFLVIVGNLFLLHRAYTDLVRWFFSLAVWASIMFLAFVTGGVDTDAYKVSFIVILIAGILGGGRSAFLLASLSIVAGLVMLLVEENRLLPQSLLESSPIGVWFSMVIVFVMTAVWLDIAAKNIANTLAKLQESNHQLRDYTAQLEQQDAALRQERDFTQDIEATLRQASERLTILHQIEQGILAAQSAEEIATSSLKQIQRLVPCERISLALFDFETDEAVLFAVALSGNVAPNVGEHIPLTAFTSIPILKQGQHFVGSLVEDRELTLIEKRRFEEEGIRSFLHIPLIARQELIGSLNLATSAINPWQPEHITIAHEIAAQLAIAVEQTRLFAAAERRADELEALRQIGLQIAMEMDQESLLESIVFHAAKILDGGTGNLLLYQPDRDVLELTTKYGTRGLLPGYTMKPGEGAGGKAWQTGRPIIANNYKQWEGRIEALEDVVGAFSLISAPIRWGDEKLGVLTIAAKSGNHFDAADAELLDLFAANVAVVLHNARLHDDVRRYVTELEREVVERKQVEQALQEQRDFAEQVLSQMGQGLTVADVDERFTFVNEAFAQMVGMRPEDLIGIKTTELSRAGITVIEQAIAARQEGKITSYELRVQRPNGSWLDMLVTGVPRWQGEHIVGSIAVVTDLTAQKEAEREREQLIAELEARNSELERFTYTVSHDLKSPLVTVKGFLGFLEKDVVRGEVARVQQDVNRIREATEKMELLLNDLLELSRIGRIVNPPQIISFNELAEAAVKLVAGQITARGVEVRIAPEMPLVKVDKQRLVEVLQNLLDNGVKFMGEQPEPYMEIGWRRMLGQNVFIVRDNGIGIAPQFHEKVFGLFDRLDPTVEGTGIGLALVQRIVEVHNGRIWIESDGVGKGTAVCFTLPIYRDGES